MTTFDEITTVSVTMDGVDETLAEAFLNDDGADAAKLLADAEAALPTGMDAQGFADAARGAHEAVEAIPGDGASAAAPFAAGEVVVTRRHMERPERA